MPVLLKQTFSKPHALFFIFLFFVQALHAQNHEVRGRAVDSSGTGISGVSVTVRGKNVGVASDANGNFKINAATGDVLVLSSTGYATAQATVGNSDFNTITLVSQTQQLSDVVVVGYGTRRRRDITSAVSVVGSKDIEKSTAFSPELAMQGQMAGVNVTSAGGNPTARPTIRIRGVSSFNNADPLYVIDGIPLVEGGAGATVDPVNDPTRRGPINLYTILNPNDIESITVLKDASATAIYGVRAANGVILVTTKQGRKGRVRVDFDADYGTQKIPKTFDVLGTQPYVKFYTDAYNANPDIKNGALVLIDSAEFFGPLWNPSNPDYIGNRKTYNWQDAVINHKSILQNYNVRVSGASDNTSYNFSAGYSNNDGPFVGYNAVRYSLSTNVVSKIGKYLETGINLRGIQTATKNPDATITLEVFRAAPWQQIYDPNGPYGYAPLWTLKDPITPSTFNTLTLYAHQYVAYSNVLGNLATQDYRSQNQTGIGNAYVQLQPIPGLRLKASISGQQSTITNKRWTGFDAWWFGENPQNPFTGVVNPVAGTKPGVLAFGNSQTASITKAINLDYLKSFGRHNLDITLDASQQQYKWTTNGAERSVTTNDPTLRYFSVTGSEKAYYELRAAYGLIGYLARVSYNYNSKYYVEGVVRRDGSSRFSPNYRFATFPAGSVGWRISQERFMEGLAFLNDLKLRASYGLAGNENTTPGWKYLSASGTVPPSYGTGTPTTNNIGIAFGTFPNEPLTWEKVYSSDIGLDAALFNNSLFVTADYYHRKTKGIIQSVSLAPSTGFGGAADLNIAEVLNRGFEFSASYNKHIGQVGLNLTGNFTTVHNEVLKLLNNTALRNQGLEVGLPIGFIYGYKVGGIFQDTSAIVKWNQSQKDIISKKQAPGDIYFQNLYGPPTAGSTAHNLTPDSVVNEIDRTYIGNTIPKFYYGFTLGADYKGFDVSIFFQGRGDVQKYNYARAAGEGMEGYGRSVFTSVLNAWTPQNKSTTMPRAVYGDPNGNNRFSDRFVEDAGYLRLQNVQIGYTFPRKWLDRTHGTISNLRLYVSGVNLFTVTDWSGLDPENDYYPSTRQYIAGIKASF